MFLLLILNDCCSDGIVGEASDVFGYRVWVLVYRVWCFHPSWTGCLHAPSRLVASCQCQHPARLFYQHLCFFREVLPVGCCSSCWFTPGTPVAVGRSPSPAHCDRDRFCSDRRAVGVSRQLSRQCVADPWWWTLIWNLMKVDGHFTRDMCGGYFPW